MLRGQHRGFAVDAVEACRVFGSRRSCEFATDPKVCARILAGSSDKGEGLERFVSLNAFDPIRATESVNGEEWRRQREAVQRVLEKISKRTDALEERVKQALCNVSDLTSMHCTMRWRAFCTNGFSVPSRLIKLRVFGLTRPLVFEAVSL
jgi:hypothetical protein